MNLRRPVNSTVGRLNLELANQTLIFGCCWFSMLEALATGNQLCLTTLRGLAPGFETARCVRWLAPLRVAFEVG
jgi:hypothetical protein